MSGEGRGRSWSREGRAAVILDLPERRGVKLARAGEGQTRELSGAGIEYTWARYFPDGQRVLVAAIEPRGGIRLYQQPVSGGKPVALAPDIFLRNPEVSPDGTWIACTGSDTHLAI